MRSKFFMGVLAIQCALSGPARTDDFSWSALAGGDFQTAGNWSPNAVPGTGDTAIFDAGLSGNVTLSADVLLGRLHFDTGATSFSLGNPGGNSITFDDGGAIAVLATLEAGTRIFTINAPVVLTPDSPTTNGTFTIRNDAVSSDSSLNVGGGISSGATTGVQTLTLEGSNTGDNRISGIISNGGAASLAVVKDGSGTWTLSAANTYTGGTRIAAGTLALEGGNNRLATNGTLAFTGESGTLDLGSTSQTVSGLSFTLSGISSHVITGAGGALTVAGGSIQIGGGNTAATSASQTVDMSGLSQFTYTNAGGNFNVGGTTNNASSAVTGNGTLTLAVTNSITAANFNLSPYSTGLGSRNSGTVHLGRTNTIHANNILIGSEKTTALLDFQNLVNPTLRIRGTGGTDADRASILVGRNLSGLTPSVSTVDLTSGGTVVSTLDAMVSSLNIAANLRNTNSVGNPVTGSFIMGLGLLDATSITVGSQDATILLTTASGPATALLSLDGGTILTPMLTLADKRPNAAATPQTITSTFDLKSGTLSASLIQRGGAGTGAGANSATIHFNWADGTISNIAGSNQIVSGNTAVNGLTGGLNIALTNTGNVSGTHTWDVSGSQTSTVQSTVTLSGPGGLTKTGTGNLIFEGSNSYAGTTRIEAGALQFGTKSSLYDGETSAWTEDRLYVAAGATARFNVGGAGEFGSTDIGILQALGSATGGFQSGSFLGLDTSNAAGEFTHSVPLGNPNGGVNALGLIKLGSGTLHLSEANTHTGGTFIEAGTLKVSGGSDRLPGTLSFTGTSGTLDVGATSQTLSGLNFPQLGTSHHVITGAGGSLTVSAGGNFQIGGGDSTATSAAQTVDMSGLSNFVYSGGGSFNVGGTTNIAVGSVSGDGTLTMAQTNFITAVSFNVSPFSTGLSSQNSGTIHLGQTNTIHASTILIGGQKTVAVLDFQDLVDPTLRIRGTGGTDANRAAITVGTNGSGILPSISIVDLTSGGTVDSILDAKVSTLLIGQAVRNGSPGFSSTGSFIMGRGLLDATSIILGQQRDVTGANSSSNAIATLGLNGGTIQTESLILADKISGAVAQTITSTFNLNSGRLNATTITRGAAGTGAGANSAAIHFNWVDGTIGNIDGSNQTVSGNTAVNGLTGGLNIVLNDSGNVSGTHTWEVSGSQTSTIESTVTLSGLGGLTKTGTGTLLFSGANSYSGMTHVSAGELHLNATGGGAVAGDVTVNGGIVKLLQAEQINTSRNLLVTGGSFDLQSSNQTLANVVLDGGSLLGGTGVLTSTNAFDLRSGTAAAILGGSAGIVKSSAGTVILSGANTFSGGTTVSEGILIAAGPSSLGANSGVSVAAGATFAYRPASAGALSLGSGNINFAAGSTLGTVVGGTLGQSSINSTGTALASGSITVDVWGITGVAASVGTHTLLSVTGGGLTSGGATYAPRYFNLTNLTPTNFLMTDTSLSVTLASATALTTGYWKGGLAGGSNLWAVSNGGASNWVTNANGTGPSPVVPGAGTTVNFSATGATNQGAMELGADMSIRNLVVSDASAVTLGADGHSLTITNASGITVNGGAGPVTLNVPLVLSATQTWTNNSSSLLTIGGDISGGSSTLTVTGTGNTRLEGGLATTGGLTKNNTGTLAVAGNNTFSGTFTINTGTVDVSGGLVSRINLGAASSTAVLNILPGATIHIPGVHGAPGSPGITPGIGSGSNVAINQSGGDVISPGQMIFGQGGSGAYAFYNMSGGTFLLGDRFRVGGGISNSTGVVYQSGGAITLTFANGLEVGANATGGYVNSQGVAYLTGGSLVAVSNRIGYNLSTTSTGGVRGEQTVAGNANVTVNGITVLGQAAGDVGILNLNGGTYSTRRIARGNAASTSILNFDGGTLRASTSADGGNFLSGLGSATVYSGGLTTDTNNQNLTIGQALLAPTGNGVLEIPVTNGGTGYIGAPYLSLTGGGGSGATAVANMVDDGTGNGTFRIGSITVTSAGNDYTSAPVVSTIGGGGTGAIFGPVTTGATDSGGLTKIGAGTLTLTGASTYTGGTAVENGILQLGNGGTTGSLSPVGSISLAGGTKLIVRRSNTATQGTDFANGISGAGGFEQAGTGTTVLTAGNSYAGRTAISAGTLSISADSSLGAAPSVALADQLSISGNATLRTTGDFSIVPTRGITVGSGGARIETAAATTLTVESNIVLNGNLGKTGDGSLLLNGATSGSGSFAVEDGTLGGDGIVTGDVLVSAGAQITAGSVGAIDAPLMSDIGSLSIGGDLAMSAGSTWLIDLVQGTTGSADRIDVGDVLNLSSSNLVINFGGSFEPDKVYTIATYGTSLTGTFNGLAEGAFVDPGNLYFINYGSGPGGAITLTAVPEPATAGLLGLVAGVSLIVRRKRRRASKRA